MSDLRKELWVKNFNRYLEEYSGDVDKAAVIAGEAVDSFDQKFTDPEAVKSLRNMKNQYDILIVEYAKTKGIIVKYDYKVEVDVECLVSYEAMQPYPVEPEKTDLSYQEYMEKKGVNFKK